MNPQIIRLTILAELARSAEFALPADQVLVQVNLRLRPTITLDQLRTFLSWLLDHGYVDFIPDTMEADNAELRRWTIKEKGLAALKK